MVKKWFATVTQYPSTNIFSNIHFNPRNICPRIFENEYFSPIFVICLQRLQKTDKFATKNEYLKKKTVHVTSSRYDRDGPSWMEKKYSLFVLGNFHRQIFFPISILILEISVDRYLKTNIFLRYLLSVYKDSKKQINLLRKMNIWKKDGSCHIMTISQNYSTLHSTCEIVR